MTNEADLEKLVSSFCEEYIKLVQGRSKFFWPYFQKMLYGTKLFKGTVQNFTDEDRIYLCFMLWILFCDIAGARRDLEGTKFLPVFDEEMPRQLHISKSLYSAWDNLSMSLFELTPMRGGPKAEFWGLYIEIYKVFDKDFVYDKNEKRLVLDAANNMARQIYSESILREQAQ